MSVIEQIQSNAESAIQEIEAEITGLEEKIEMHKLRIQSARVQIQALKRFLNPEEGIHEVSKPSKGSKKNGKAHIEGFELQ
ncbi:hypothetical protein DCCM_3005 [Desulfocucumis palustris]|uniref:Uncharacterized protein n=1 Tax=Desulfocucumis palustris TaxID=1898651 RepID=A0A2L2XD14_9FIRM|nr:hypothetical protein [Desulfocucumis palustris]GBF33894.1 hypothetical protein DCCM_3005 [Desulfocucumis palustris]